MTPDQRLVSERFPRSSQYHPEWVLANISGGANSLWLTEWLTAALDLRPGMRVLDLGCGWASSSIFLRREFGVQVWATDLWFSARRTSSASEMPASTTACFRSMRTPDRCRSPRNSSTPSCASIPTFTTGRTRAVSLARPAEPADGMSPEGDTRAGSSPMVLSSSRCWGLRAHTDDLRAVEHSAAAGQAESSYRRLGRFLDEVRRKLPS